MLKFSPKSQAGELIFNEIKGADLFEGYFVTLKIFGSMNYCILCAKAYFEYAKAK